MAVRVLILDDEPSVLNVLAMMLKKRGYDVVALSTAVDSPMTCAMECPCLFYPACPQIVISDFDMPNLNGLDFWENQVRKGCRCRHVALISGKGLDENEFKRLSNLGMRLFHKPFDRQEIADWLDDAELSIVSAL